MAYSRIFTTSARVAFKEMGQAIVHSAKNECTVSSFMTDPDVQRGIINGIQQARETFTQASSLKQAVTNATGAFVAEVANSSSKTKLASYALSAIVSNVTNGANAIQNNLSTAGDKLTNAFAREQTAESHQSLSRRV